MFSFDLLLSKRGSTALAFSILALISMVPLTLAQEGKVIVNALVKKGILTQFEAEQLLTESAEYTAPSLVSPYAKSTSRLSIGGRLQLQYDNLSTDLTGTSDPASINHFFVRRAYFSIKGDLGDHKQINITYDFGSSSFDAAYLKWKRSDSLSFDFGLRKVNLSAEEKTSSGTVKSIERSAATRYFVEGNNGRRLGAGSHRLGMFVDGSRDTFFWNAALTNPERVGKANSLGTAANNTPAVWGGAGVKGVIHDSYYLLGAYLGFLPDQGGRFPGSGHDLIVGSINTVVSTGNFHLSAEYLASRNDQGSAAGTDTASWGVTVEPSYRFDQNWEGVFRYSYVDSDGRGISLSDGVRSAPSGGTMDTLSEYYLGFIYYISGNDLKFQAGYVYGVADDTVSGTPAHASTSGFRSQMQIQF